MIPPQVDELGMRNEESIENDVGLNDAPPNTEDVSGNLEIHAAVSSFTSLDGNPQKEPKRGNCAAAKNHCGEKRNQVTQNTRTSESLLRNTGKV